MKLLKKFFQLVVFYGAMLVNPFTAQAETTGKGSAYDYSFESLDGEPLPLSAYKGKVILVVNTASKCGFTPQYEGLEALYQTYKDRGLVVIGVPANDFGKQEPGTSSGIKACCKLNYGVSFPMATKQIVTGNDAHPFYLWVRKQLGFGASPKWNFHKYLVDTDGNASDFFLSTTAPDSDKLKRAIEALLPKTTN